MQVVIAGSLAFGGTVMMGYREATALNAGDDSPASTPRLRPSKLERLKADYRIKASLRTDGYSIERTIRPGTHYQVRRGLDEISLKLSRPIAKAFHETLGNALEGHDRLHVASLGGQPAGAATSKHLPIQWVAGQAASVRPLKLGANFGETKSPHDTVYSLVRLYEDLCATAARLVLPVTSGEMILARADTLIDNLREFSAVRQSSAQLRECLGPLSSIGGSYTMVSNGDLQLRNLVWRADGRVSVVDWDWGIVSQSELEFAFAKQWLMAFSDSSGQKLFAHAVLSKFSLDVRRVHAAIIFSNLLLIRDFRFARELLLPQLSYFEALMSTEPAAIPKFLGI